MQWDEFYDFMCARFSNSFQKFGMLQTWSATKTQKWCNLGYGKTKNPNFLCGFFWIGLKTKQMTRWIRGRSPSKPWKSDTKMIWGGPIFLWAMQWWWWQRMIQLGINWCHRWTLLVEPCCQCNSPQPCRIFTTPHTCAHSRRPWNGNLQSTDSQWKNRSH
jgi:hypothetical protein